MAGIVGVAVPGETAEVEETLARIAHRGRAGQSVRSLPFATFGEVWPEAQKALFVDVEDHAVALDGEVHNWTALAAGATSPLEAIEWAYERVGPDFVALLDGPFALAISTPGGVFLGRDVVGKSPLYWGKWRGVICFASEVKGLLPIASDIRAFPPGHYYDPNKGLVRFGEIAMGDSLRMPAGEIAGALRARLVESVSKRMRGGTVGAWLSGGLDSATMAALPEVIYHLESFDCLLVRSSLVNFLVGKLASDHVPAVLSGEGGDELFAGYSYLKRLPAEQLPEELVDITRRLHNTALQRVDRCSAGHGLVARTAFLDREVLDYALRIPPCMKIHRETG